MRWRSPPAPSVCARIRASFYLAEPSFQNDPGCSRVDVALGDPALAQARRPGLLQTIKGLHRGVALVDQLDGQRVARRERAREAARAGGGGTLGIIDIIRQADHQHAGPPLPDHCVDRLPGDAMGPPRDRARVRGTAAHGVAAGDADAPLTEVEREDDLRRGGARRAYTRGLRLRHYR